MTVRVRWSVILRDGIPCRLCARSAVVAGSRLSHFHVSLCAACVRAAARALERHEAKRPAVTPHDGRCIACRRRSGASVLCASCRCKATGERRKR